ncbi:MAG: amidohydrolase [Clostridia bacterium]|nr:amidohydrolase [Clostridia bacterium]
MKKIDCHTHIITENIREEYFSRADNPAIVMQFPPRLFHDPDSIAVVQSDPRLFLCPYVDLEDPIAPRLAQIEAHLDDWKVVGLKIYTSYQKGSADEPRMDEIYRFADCHRLTVTFHTGLCSLVLPSAQDLAGSDASRIAKAAERFPAVNFVAAHMNDPKLRACCRLCAAHPNLFTDYSGLFEAGYEGDWEILKKGYGGAMRAAGCYSQVLFGTDFCPPIGLTDIERFDAFLSEVIPSEFREAVYYRNALRAFPRLAAHIKEF